MRNKVTIVLNNRFLYKNLLFTPINAVGTSVGVESIDTKKGIEFYIPKKRWRDALNRYAKSLKLHSVDQTDINYKFIENIIKIVHTPINIPLDFITENDRVVLPTYTPISGVRRDTTVNSVEIKSGTLYKNCNIKIPGFCDVFDCIFCQCKFIETISYPSFTNCWFIGADFTGLELSMSQFFKSHLLNSSFDGSSLERSQLRDCTIENTSFFRARLRDLDMLNCTFRGFDSRTLELADINKVNFSGSTGLPDPIEWMDENFGEPDKYGYIVYKSFSNSTPCSEERNKKWKPEPGLIITEQVNPNRTTCCGSGVSFGTRNWCIARYGSKHLWVCRLHYKDLLNVVVPFETDGKARCGRLELLRPA